MPGLIPGSPHLWAELQVQAGTRAELAPPQRCGRGQSLVLAASSVCLGGPDPLWARRGADVMGSEGTEVPGPGGPGTRSPPHLLMEPCCLPSPQLAPGVNSGQGLGIEIIGTLQLVLCVLATTDRRRRDLGGSGPLAIGLSVALGHLLAVSVESSRVGMGRTGPGTLSWAGGTGDRVLL